MRHYMANRGSIIPLNCGHCTVRKIKVKVMSNFPYKMGCELWEDDIPKKEKQKELLFKKLEVAIQDINVIMQILKEFERSKTE